MPDKGLLSKALGTEFKTSRLSTEAVLFMCWGLVFLEAPADKGSLLLLGECPSCERPILVDQAFLAPPPLSESELSQDDTTPSLGLMGLRLFVLV